jgi:hypothetical protein
MSKVGDNYPDDIREYDNHPHSPFYVEDTTFECDHCGECGDADNMTDDEVSNYDDSKMFCCELCRNEYDFENFVGDGLKGYKIYSTNENGWEQLSYIRDESMADAAISHLKRKKRMNQQVTKLMIKEANKDER